MSDTQEPTVKPGFELFQDEFAAPITAATESTEVAVEDGSASVDTNTKLGAFEREIDLGDGSGKQVFKGATAEELIDKLVTAQANATIKIREQQIKLRARPDTQAPEVFAPGDPQALTADELFTLAQELQSDPAKAFDKILQTQVGLSSAQLRQMAVDYGNNQQIALAAKAEQEFLAAHPNDFQPSAKNAQRIIDFIKSENLPYTSKNIEYAFQELSEGGLLDAPVQTVTEKDGKPRIEVAAHTRKPAVTGLTSRTNSARQPEPESKDAAGLTEAEVDQIYALPIEKAREVMLKKMRSAGR
jgi:hypothetical protein